MEERAKKQLYSEEQNWLNRGRVCLLKNLLGSVNNPKAPLLDFGAGSGHAIATLTAYGDVDAIELAPEAQDYLKQKPVRHIYTEGLPHAQIDEKYGVIVGLEVLEHIEDEVAAVDWIDAHLKEGGHLLLTVPAYQWLFGPHDVANQHFRRYTKTRLLKVLPAEYTILKSGYFLTALFPLAVMAKAVWALKTALGKKEKTQQKQSSNLPGFIDRIFYNVLAFEAYLAGKGAGMPFGLTAYALLKKEKN